MRKILYIIMLAFTVASVTVSCTEEEVTPQSDNGGGGASDPTK
ncbi:hypothetical protein [Ohtaekwangia sp.]